MSLGSADVGRWVRSGARRALPVAPTVVQLLVRHNTSTAEFVRGTGRRPAGVYPRHVIRG
jgi:hypothetical protein